MDRVLHLGLVALYVVGMIVTIRDIGKTRTPLTSNVAATVTVLYLLLIFALLVTL